MTNKGFMMRIYIFTPLFLTLFAFSCLNATAPDLKKTLELKFTSEEEAQMERWKNKTDLEMVKDACADDPAAMYLVGMCQLTGLMGNTISIQKADVFFSSSASLGFAPSVEQLMRRERCNENPFLVLVYMNILTSLSHQEFVSEYHELIQKMSVEMGGRVVEEIEKIAKEKREKIDLNKELLEDETDKEKVMVKTFSGVKYKLIDKDDADLGYNYWVKFSKFHEKEELVLKSFQIIIKETSELFQLLEAIRKSVDEIFETQINNTAISEEHSYLLKEKVLKALSLSSELKSKMGKFESASNENLSKLASELTLLFQCTVKRLEQDLLLIDNPKNYSQSESDLENFIETHDNFNRQELNIQIQLESLKG